MSFARARTRPCGVSRRTQSPAVIPRAAAVDGCISTCGSGAGRDQRLPELDERLRLLAVFEADLQCLGFERGGHRQHDVGKFGRRVMNRSAWTKKSRLRSASRPRTLSAWAITMLPPKLTSALIRPSRAAV